MGDWRMHETEETSLGVWSMHPPPPSFLHEYQEKGVTGKAFRKSLILKGAILVVLGWQGAEMAALKKKSGSKLPHSKQSYLQN